MGLHHIFAQHWLAPRWHKPCFSDTIYILLALGVFPDVLGLHVGFDGPMGQRAGLHEDALRCVDWKVRTPIHWREGAAAFVAFEGRTL